MEALGFKVEKLTEPNDRKEVDFLAEFGCDCFLVEAKIKTDSEVQLAEKEEALSGGELFVAEDSLGRDETISKIIANASRQIRESSGHHNHKYKLIFMFCFDINTKTKFEKIIDTLYGRTQIIEINKPNPKSKPCYFFRHADLYRRKDYIDAVIVGYESADGSRNFLLCLNNYSDKYRELRFSALAKKFSNALIDPIEEEKNNSAYIPDANIERSKQSCLFNFQNPMLHHLKEKYKTEILISFDFNSPEISIRGSRD